MAKKIILSNNIRSIKSQAKTLPIEFLESVLEKFELVIAERRKLEILSKKQLEEHNKKVDEYLSLIKQDGIDVKELLKSGDYPAFRKLRKKRPVRPPKYKYYDDHGNLKTWTGQGRMPKPIQIELKQDRTKSLDDFLI